MTGAFEPAPNPRAAARKASMEPAPRRKRSRQARALRQARACERAARHRHERVVRDEDFAHLYAPGFGRPSIPPSVMVRAMSRTTHDRASDAETSRRTRLDFNLAFDAADQAVAITCPAGQRPATDRRSATTRLAGAAVHFPRRAVRAMPAAGLLSRPPAALPVRFRTDRVHQVVGRIDAAKRLGERSAVEYVSRHDLHPRRQDCASSLPGVRARHRTQ